MMHMGEGKGDRRIAVNRTASHIGKTLGGREKGKTERQRGRKGTGR